MENYLWIRDKRGSMVAFRMNAIQQILAQYVAQCWLDDVPVKVITPKSRQLGSSTFWQALFFSLAELKPGYRVSVVAHKEDGAREVISRSQTFLRQLRKRGEWPTPKIVNEQSGYIAWEHESSMQVGTIKTGDGLGFGGTPSAIHFSESANFADKGVDAKKTVTGIVNACADNEWTIIVHESTAKGKDPFYWPMCEDARNPGSGSVYRLIFLPWFLEPGYAMSWGDYRKQMLASGNNDPGSRFHANHDEEKLRRQLEAARVRPGEELYRYSTTLSDEQLIWRRWTLTNKCHNDEDELKRYYPSFYEECFSASTSCMFDPPTIDWFREHSTDPQETGRIEQTHNGAAFVRETRGPVQIWQQPIATEDYVIGADPGGEKTRSDPYCAYVVNARTLETVACLHGHFAWDWFADTLYDLGLYYNRALLVVENNHQPAIGTRLHRFNYPNLYYYFDGDKVDATQGKTPGFNMNVSTRRKILSRLAQECRQRYYTNRDPEFWREMENMVWVPRAQTDNPDRDGTYRAVGSNHDDRILAAAMAVFFCSERDVRLEQHEKPLDMSPAYRIYLKLLEEQRRENLGGFLNLSGVSRA